MQDLGFVIIDDPKFGRVKVRQDGRRGHAVADEAKLWDALQEAKKLLADAVEQNEKVKQLYWDADKAIKELTHERDDLKFQLEAARQPKKR